LIGVAMVFGPQIQLIQQAHCPATVCAIFPVGKPPDNSAAMQPALVFLPEYDQIGYAQSWRTWADAHQCPLRVVDGVGQDIRSQWPQLLKICMEQPFFKSNFAVHGP
jgi:hypothetical protein